MILKKIFIGLLLLSSGMAISQKANSKGNVIVDKKGVMRWEITKEEVHGFGVNYTVPFAHSYRTAKRMGVNIKQVIDNDVYHFTRLGFDLYRVHIWDTQISDTQGNLLQNEYLDAFDYLVFKLKQHNINYVITPIAFWGDGWPEPDTETPGFSHKYGKDKALTDPEAIKAQQTYLFQFLNHVNPYTKLAYKVDSSVIAFEVSNEPHHRGEPETVTKFVEGMVKAMRKTGTKKLIFYNMSHAVQFMDAYYKGDVDGGTFQWYPTGLGYQRELSGNLLPNVNDYKMPFENIIKKYHGAKLVYEFDAADVGKSYIYPAMARSFRTAGIQIATHFSYDPTFMAANNTEYNTHYMNLVYTPQKAISLKICSEVFHEIPMYSEFGTYPKNTTFGNFKVNYKNDLAEYNSEEKFFYTNTTETFPKNESKLKEIAGYGNSSLIKYNGVGAYFLDKISDGNWRLEVLPDAVWVDNPFGRNSPDKTIGVVKWETHQITLNMKDLGKDFSIEAINKDNSFSTKSDGASFVIRPGTYMLTRNGAAKNWTATDAFKTNKLNDFFAPETTVEKSYLIHKPLDEVAENQSLVVAATFVAPTNPKEILVTGFNSEGSYFKIPMQSKGFYEYTVEIPSETMKTGFLNYNIIVKMVDDSEMTYPSGKNGSLYDWDFYDRTPYKITVVPKDNPIYLFNAYEDSELLVREWRKGFKLIPTMRPNEAEYQMHIGKLFGVDEENLNAEPLYDYSFKHFVIDEIKGRTIDLKTKDSIVFYGRSLKEKPIKIQIALVLDDGSAHGKVIEIGTELKEYKLAINDLKPVKTVTLPRPYPSFLPYYLEHAISSRFDINRVESLQFSIGPEISRENLTDSFGMGIISVTLE